MTQQTPKQTGKTIEDSFFARESEELRLRMKEEMESADKRKALATTLEIQSEALLDNLLQAGIEVETMPALSLIPLVAVGWADGAMDAKQRTAILQASSDDGIREDHTAHSLLLTWLAKKPSTRLFDTWLEYVQTLAENREEPRRTEFIGEIVDRARRVAQATGGILGMRRINKAETAVLKAIEAAMHTAGE